MKILVTTSTYSRHANDTEPKFVDNLCHHLAEDNEVHVIAPHAPGIPRQESMAGIPVFRFRYCFESWQTLAYDGGILPSLRQNKMRALLIPLFVVSQFFLVIKLMRKHNYDIIHAHWIIPQGLVAVLARPFARSRPALVLTSHGGDLFALKGPLLSKLKRWITNRADVLTVVSSAMKTKAAGMGLKEAAQIANIPMGLDTRQTFIPDPLNTDRKRLLFVGRLVDKKGIEYLLRAMPQILEQWPDVHLTIVGDGPLRQSLGQLCADLSISDKVLFTGAMTNLEIPRYLQRSAIAIFPSVVTHSGDQEGTPVSIMEALACGCATIVADYPGVTDIISDNETGLIVAGKSPQAIAEAVLKLMDSPELQTTLSENGRNMVQEQYDWRVISRKFLTTFQSLKPRP